MDFVYKRNPCEIPTLLCEIHAKSIHYYAKFMRNLNNLISHDGVYRKNPPLPSLVSEERGYLFLLSTIVLLLICAGSSILRIYNIQYLFTNHHILTRIPRSLRIWSINIICKICFKLFNYSARSG